MGNRSARRRIGIATLSVGVLVSVAGCSGDGSPEGGPITRPSSTLIGATSTDVSTSEAPASTEVPAGSEVPPATEGATTTIEPPATEVPVSTDASTTTRPPATVPAEDLVWPTPDWATKDPAEAGLDPAKLAVMAAQAEAAESDCLVITHDGSIVGEWYWNGTNERSEREAFSVTKSISSTLVGIAIDQGLLSLDQKASEFIPEWVGTPSEDITVRNLVSNDSGRFQTFESDYVMMPRADNQTAYAVALAQEHEIGEVWVYNNAAIQTLEAVIEGATGMHVGDFATKYLLGPLGMNTTIVNDKAGNTLTYMGAQASCRDLARFGLLFLRGGEWDGKQIVSREWVDEATTPSTELNAGYGFLWWLNAEGHIPDGQGGAGFEGQMVPGAPDDMFAALGLFDQLIGVLPSEGLVITRMGESEGADGTTFNLGDLAYTIEDALIR